MKKFSIASLFLVFVFIASCKPEKPGDINFELLGKWMLTKTVEQEYHPINTLVYEDEYTGLPGDSLIFKGNGIVYQYIDGDTEVEETGYKVLNDSTINIEDEIYKIRKISDTEICLHEEEIDQAFDEKWVYQVYLKR